MLQLHLGGNQIGAEGAEALGVGGAEDQLHVVAVASIENEIGTKGTEALVEALQTTSTLRHLDLDANNIGVSGAVALGKALKTNSM